jgi:hypothetical protein
MRKDTGSGRQETVRDRKLRGQRAYVRRMAVIAFVLLTIAVFALLGVIQRALES